MNPLPYFNSMDRVASAVHATRMERARQEFIMAEALQEGQRPVMHPFEAMGVRGRLEAKCVVDAEYVSPSRVARAKRQSKTAVREAGLRAGLAGPLVGMGAKGTGQWRTN